MQYGDCFPQWRDIWWPNKRNNLVVYLLEKPELSLVIRSFVGGKRSDYRGLACSTRYLEGIEDWKLPVAKLLE